MTVPHVPAESAADPLRALRPTLAAGDFAAGAAQLETLLARTPDDPRAWGLLGRCRRLLGELDGAAAALERSLALAPGLVASRRELALLRRAQGRHGEAATLLQALAEASPGQVDLLWELALLHAESDPAAALDWLARLRALRPADPEPALLQAQLLLHSGRPERALAAFEALLAQRPRWPEALEGAWRARVALDDPAPARAALLRQLTALAPTPGRWLALAQEEARLGDFAAAQAAIGAALALDPDFLPARWAAFQLPAEIAPADPAALDAFRSRWQAGLEAFEAIDFAVPAAAAQVWDCVGQSTAFYRHYLGDEVGGLQRRYGALLARMMAAIAPPAAAPAVRAGNRPRIGVVSAHLRAHTVARLFGPWIEQLGRHGFEVHVFALQPPSPQWRARLAAVATLVEGPRDWQAWRQTIVAAAPDVLLYPEVGMDAPTQGLAALRLAPRQYALWGHPVSTGLPTIDGFLSPDAMEPADAGQHYSERLLRLPGLGHGLQPESLPAPEPVALPPAAGDCVELLCAQTAYKLLPAQDRLFGAILAERPQARLHLLADPRPAVQARLRARIATTLAACGADPDRQLLIHGFLPLPSYLGLAAACALNLDSIGWSGGMSSLDLLGQGLPTLTLPGATMRSRQTAALLARLDAGELVAVDDDDYVARAIALIDAPAERAALRARLRDRRARLFAEPAAFEALVALLVAGPR